MKKNTIPLALLIIFCCLLGYFRNFVFLSINSQMSSVYYHDSFPILPSAMQFITHMDYTQLIRLKWILTFLFALIFCITATGSIYLIYKKKIYVFVCIVLYGTLFLVSTIFMLCGYLWNSFSLHAYNIARNIIHIGQSPFTILLLIMVIYYHKRLNSTPVN